MPGSARQETRPQVHRSKDPASGGIPSEELLQAAPTDWRQPAARSSGSAFQTKCLVYDMSTMHMRWRLASSTMLHVNPKVRGQHPRRLERRAGSPPLSSRWSSTNVEITDCQLGQLITGQLGFGGGVCHHRMPPRSGRETSARIDRSPNSPYPIHIFLYSKETEMGVQSVNRKLKGHAQPHAHNLPGAGQPPAPRRAPPTPQPAVRV